MSPSRDEKSKTEVPGRVKDENTQEGVYETNVVKGEIDLKELILTSDGRTNSVLEDNKEHKLRDKKVI